MDKKDNLYNSYKIRNSMDRFANALSYITNQAKEEGEKKGKRSFVDAVYDIPKLQIKAGDKKEETIIMFTLIQVRDYLLTHILDLTLEQAEISAKKFAKKRIEENKKCCTSCSNDSCNRLCPIDCPDYKKPCGKAK